MNKLYYGSGSCTVNGEIILLEITYRGAVKIQDKTSDHFRIKATASQIIILPTLIGSPDETLSNLFEYEGEFRIIRARAIDLSKQFVSIVIQRVMDYSELMDSNSEDLTTVSEKLNAGYVYGNRVSKTTIEN